MEGSAEDLGAPESWEVADLDESMNRLNLILSSNKDSKTQQLPDDDASHHFSATPGSSSSSSSSGGDKVSDDLINQVDQFLREAIQNPRERLSVLRMEQDVEKFIRDPHQQQLEFQQLPTSYLRLAAHRIAQHYSLQSMVLLDNSLPDGSGSRIIVRKTPECKLPAIRLADIPVKLSPENNVVMKVAIKQRPQKRTQVLSNANSNSVKNSGSKSVEERKEEYNRARARIFSSSNNGGVVVGKPECESKQQDKSLKGSLGVPRGVSRGEDKNTSASDASSSRGLVESSANTNRGLVESSTNISRGLVESSTNISRGLVESSTNTSRGLVESSTNISRGLVESSTNTSRGLVESSSNISRGLVESSTNTSRGVVESSTNTSRARSRTEKESVGRYRQSNRVAIFRDREVDRKDPDYDRSYDRYMQRFDPGFGFNAGSYTMQPLYAPVLNYNTEFPQLGSTHGPQLSVEHQHRPLPQHIPGPWAAQSTPAGIGYGHPETMMSPFNPSQVAPHSSTMYLHSSQFPLQRPGMSFIHHEHVHQPFAQSHQPPPDASFGLARPR